MNTSNDLLHSVVYHSHLLGVAPLIQCISFIASTTYTQLTSTSMCLLTTVILNYAFPSITIEVAARRMKFTQSFQFTWQGSLLEKQWQIESSCCICQNMTTLGAIGYTLQNLGSHHHGNRSHYWHTWGSKELTIKGRANDSHVYCTRKLANFSCTVTYIGLQGVVIYTSLHSFNRHMNIRASYMVSKSTQSGFVFPKLWSTSSFSLHTCTMTWCIGTVVGCLVARQQTVILAEAKRAKLGGVSAYTTHKDSNMPILFVNCFTCSVSAKNKHSSHKIFPVRVHESVSPQVCSLQNTSGR